MLSQALLSKKKYEYSPLGKIFTKGLYKDDQEEGLLKRFKKNIEDENFFDPKQFKILSKEK